MPDELLISMPLVAKRADGSAVAFDFEVHRPVSERGEMWRCIVAMDGICRPLRIGGADALQALCLALDMARWEVRRFEDDGGTLMDDDGPFSIQSYRFTEPGPE